MSDKNLSLVRGRAEAVRAAWRRWPGCWGSKWSKLPNRKSLLEMSAPAEARSWGLATALRLRPPGLDLGAASPGARSSMATFREKSGRLAESKGEEGTWEPGMGRSREGTWVIVGPLGFMEADLRQDPASHALLACSRRCGQACWAQPAEKRL